MVYLGENVFNTKKNNLTYGLKRCLGFEYSTVSTSYSLREYPVKAVTECKGTKLCKIRTSKLLKGKCEGVNLAELANAC